MANIRFTKSTVTLPNKIKLPSSRREKATPEEKQKKSLIDSKRSEDNHQTPEADQHAEYITKVTAGGQRRAYNTTQTVLDYYLKKGYLNSDNTKVKSSEQIAIGKARHAAGERFYRDFYMSRLIPGMKSCLDVREGGRSSVNNSGLNFQAYEAYVTAAQKIHSRYRKITIGVCCADEFLFHIKSTVPIYRRMDALHRGLDMLIEHYENKINPRKVMASFHASVTTTMG